MHGANVKIVTRINVMTTIPLLYKNVFVVSKTAEISFKLLITPWKRILLEKLLLSIETSGTLYPKHRHVPKT